MINKVCAFILISFFIFLVSSIVFSYILKYDIDNNGKIIIGKYVAKKSYPKTESNYFIYYEKGKKYRENGGTAPLYFHKNIGKFYKMKYLDKYPNVIHPLYDQEVTDTVEILKAGFSMDEILILNKKTKTNDLFPSANSE